MVKDSNWQITGRSDPSPGTHKQWPRITITFLLSHIDRSTGQIYPPEFDSGQGWQCLEFMLPDLSGMIYIMGYGHVVVKNDNCTRKLVRIDIKWSRMATVTLLLTSSRVTNGNFTLLLTSSTGHKWQFLTLLLTV